jgi:undecaprenyl-diphosphatase
VIAGRRRAAGFVLLAVAGGVALSSILKIGFARPRPGTVPDAVAVSTAGFPGGHAMMSAVPYLTLGNLLAGSQPSLAGKVHLVLLAPGRALLVGCSRGCPGVHRPTKVLAGWAAGACWALLSWLLMARLRTAGRVEPDIRPPAGRNGPPA